MSGNVYMFSNRRGKVFLYDWCVGTWDYPRVGMSCLCFGQMGSSAKFLRAQNDPHVQGSLASQH